ncbi:MAG TPA: hypothetical protein EYQ25_02790 [Planctomycetes bacterium]|nr:hypothetical protein [Planctomycetota bacterium]HIL36303.1 hypothetical protein [Planctomycetota bacterium]
MLVEIPAKAPPLGLAQPSPPPSQRAGRFTNVSFQGVQCMNLPAPGSCGLVQRQVAVMLHHPCADMKGI